MAKIRIYELARDLNMTNKVLLEKIREIDLPVKNHMSSLDEESIVKLKAFLFGAQGEEVEETRINPTIIRRRRKVIPNEPGLPASPESEADSPVELHPEEEQVQAADAQETPPQVEAPASPQADTPPEPETVSLVKPKKPLKSEPAAKVIQRPETPETDAGTDAETDAEAVEESQASQTEATETVSEPEADAAMDSDQQDEAPAVAATPPEPEVPSEPEEADAQKAAPKILKPTKKKAKRETAAKIIKMPDPSAVIKKKPAVDKTKVTSFPKRRPAAQGIETTTPGAEDKSKKKWGKKGKDIDPDRRFSKKKISFKRKEVVERAQLYSIGKRGRRGKRGAKGRAAVTGQKPQITTAKAIKRRIKVDDTIVLSELAKRMGFKANELIAKLMGLGVMATVNQTIDFDTAVLVAAEFDYEVERAAFEEESFLKQETDDPDTLSERPPVVTVMGHVDHGKTSLLDVIRKSRITESEAGGITQHIGAYHVTTDNGQIVFLDTPGHEAFTAMRSRGAQITDLVVLVVAADDGVMPQTVEAVNHSKAAGVPIIVAINKIDKANAEPDRVQRELAELGLTPEAWGGDTIFVPVSAKEKQGVEEILEMILLQAEVLELKANAAKLASGHVVEAKLDSGRGAVATILVKEGTLRVGDPVVCGVHYGKIRSLLDDQGQQVDSAGPSMPVEVVGLSGVPQAGDELAALADEKDAKQVSQYRGQKQRSLELAKTSRLSLEKLFEKMSEGEVKDLNLILKADVHGSIEALRDSLVKLSNEEVNINIVHTATGTITESDVSLAAVSEAIIIGFNVRPAAKVQALAAEEHVDIRFYNIIYNTIKDVKDAIVGMMSSTYEERLLGRAEVRQVFTIPRVGAIAGSYVTDGKIERGRQARLLRDGVVVYDGKIVSLRRFKDDAKEVQSGYECGIGIENYNDIKMNDTIECYYLEEVRPEIE